MPMIETAETDSAGKSDYNDGQCVRDTCWAECRNVLNVRLDPMAGS